jgi:hypothetical protein
VSTAGQRLIALSGLTGQTAAESMKAIGHGAGLAAAALLVAYSGLASATAAVHLLTDQAATVVVGGGGHRMPDVRRLEPRGRDDEELMTIIVAALHTLENR